MRVVAYIRVSTREQAEDGHGLDAQRAQITAQAAVRGWDVVAWCEDRGLSGASMEGRNELARAIRLVESGDADAIMATKIDRVSRSVRDFADLVDRAKAAKWNLVVLDLGLDLSTPMGEFAAHILCAAAQLERRMIAERTKDGLAAAKSKGVRVGRPPGVSDVIVERITTMRDDGMTLVDIAERLTTEQIPTARGGTRWWPSTVGGVLARLDKGPANIAASR